MESQITVLKFGSSVLRSEADLPRVVHEIYRHWRSGSSVLVVVSALGATTDELVRRAENLCGSPHPSSLAALLATGEATSAALLGLAVHRAGIPVKILSPEQVSLRTTGATLDAEPVAADVGRLRKELQSAIVIVSGFVGISEEGDLTLLGRGGSDYTALFLAEKLGGCCVLVKDVAGLYESNPNDSRFRPRRFARANWKTANTVGGGFVQPKAARFAEKHRLNFSITAPGASVETEICGGTDKLALPESKIAPSKVALLGCGTIGGGVYQRLADLPEFFEIVGVAERNVDKALAAGVPVNLITTNAKQLIEKNCDVVVELIGGIETAGAFVARALNLKRRVVTANKALLAGEINRLENLAEKRGVKIHYSAAVGGVMPALETVSQARISNQLRSFSGIVNGTCNFICDELAAGNDFASAVQSARESGFAEADPQLDLNGTDAAQKLILLARAAFGVTLSLSAIQREGIENLDTAQVRNAIEKGNVIRLVAECRQTTNEIEASVKPIELPVSHPFAQTRGAENCLRLETANGKIKFLRGRGAGRWATTEAVIADLFDARSEFSAAKWRAKFAKFNLFAERNLPRINAGNADFNLTHYQRFSA